MPQLELFARAGGGGSGGSSGGDGEGILIILGYLPMHAVGAWFRRITKKHPAAFAALNVIGWVIAALYAVFWVYAWGFLGFMIGIAALVGMAAGLYGLFGKVRQSKYVQGILKTAASKDSAWDESALVEHAKKTFMRYQTDWSARRSDRMQAYLTPYYYQHASLLVQILRDMKRQDSMDDITISDATIVNAHDNQDDAHDWFTVAITAQAKDVLTDTTTNETLFTDTSPFTEYWTFQRSGNTWLLGGISQATADPLALNGQLRSLAQQHGYFYSLDMGWLFIPRRGQLFGGAKFGTSDINNHIVGLYNNQILTQIYTYSKVQDATPYVIAQVTVPRQYGNIVVRRKKFLTGGIRGLEKVETEWTDFNKKYSVYASRPDQATSFELLNPTYMEQLEALPFEVNIEVVDSSIYLYTTDQAASLEVYQQMLDILHKAFKELRL